MEEELRKDNAEGWSRFHREQSGRRERQEAIRKTAEQKPLSEKEAVELAAFEASETDDIASKVAIFRRLVESYPFNAPAACYLGTALLDTDDPEGVAMLEEWSKHDPALRQRAIQRLGAYYARHGRQADLDRLRDEAREIGDRQQIARQGLLLRLGDELLPPELSPAERERMIEGLRAVPDLGRAYALRKRLPGTGEIRDYLYVLPRPKFEVKDESQKLVNAVIRDVTFPRRTQIYCLQPRKEWRKRLDALPKALLYDHRKTAQ